MSTLRIRVILPFHLQNLAKTRSEVAIEVEEPATQRSLLDALEACFPVLRGTIRDYGTQQRRPLLRYFACERDLSFDSPDAELPPSVRDGSEPFIILGSIAGG